MNVAKQLARRQIVSILVEKSSVVEEPEQLLLHGCQLGAVRVDVDGGVDADHHGNDLEVPRRADDRVQVEPVLVGDRVRDGLTPPVLRTLTCDMKDESY